MLVQGVSSAEAMCERTTHDKLFKRFRRGRKFLVAADKVNGRLIEIRRSDCLVDVSI